MDESVAKEIGRSNMMVLNELDRVTKRVDSFKKSPNDKRLYRGLILSNAMKVLLISDPTANKSAAALDVKVGQFNDPVDLPGLAHFCEHMLFLGTEKYPDRNAYSSFLSQHGGDYNAETGLDSTIHYFDVNPKHLQGALDIFSQFFLHPLFTESAMDLEVNAVNSEYEMNLSNDHWRILQLNRSSSSPNHPYSKFGIGNRETLDTIPKQKGINVREQLLEFYQMWYSANIMSLSVLGTESLDDLETMVVDMFGGVKNKNIEPLMWPEHPFNDDHFAHKWYIVPVQDIRMVIMIFPLPEMSLEMKTGSMQYVEHLLGHEGEGSLLSALKKTGWSNSLYAGGQDAARGACNFINIIVDLTEEGIKHIDDIILFTFQYVNLMKSHGPVEWIFEECKQIAEIDYNFQEQSSPQDDVDSMVRALQMYPIDEVLSAPYLFSQWRPDLIDVIMENLVPQNIRVYVVGKVFDDIATETEFWYGTKYKKEKIPEDLIRQWSEPELNPELKLPLKNEFIPRYFDIKADKDLIVEKLPVVIEDNPLMRVWFKQDNEFSLPKVMLMLKFFSPLAYMDPVNCSLMNMYVDLLNDSFNEYTYSAGLAGLEWSLSSNQYGFVFTIDGYNDKYRILLMKIINRMMNFRIDRQRFEILKESFMRNLKNIEALEPGQQTSYYLNMILLEPYWTHQQFLDTCEYVTVEKLEEFMIQLLSKIYVECFLYGNLTEHEAMETAKLIESELKTDPKSGRQRTIVPVLQEQLMSDREISLENGCDLLYETENKYHKSSCTVVYYQSGLQSTESNMHLQLLQQIISEPCFDILRTEEQLGYIVFSAIYRSNNVQGFRVTVQSDRHPQYVEERIEEFMNSMMNTITNMSDEEFNRHKKSLAAKRLEKPKTMDEVCEALWGEISLRQYNFNRDNIEVTYLETIDKDRIVQFFKDIIHNKLATRRKLAIHIVSMADGEAGLVKNNSIDAGENSDNIPVRTKITDVAAFRASQSLFPLLNKLFDAIPRKGHFTKHQ